MNLEMGSGISKTSHLASQKQVGIFSEIEGNKIILRHEVNDVHFDCQILVNFVGHALALAMLFLKCVFLLVLLVITCL